MVRQDESHIINKDLHKLRELVVANLENSFCLLILEDSDSQLADTYDTTIRVIEFKHRF